ncbi:hypothetical protein GSI_05016 [Ganoderma sinense ZZ0214-1]|uniref:Uncharacterized protein n=1 Tax=Ganoderma sinense ZZ0214-1 TaxID=1077348 RepID=A0A2G8SH50_9APHY|nr:hypothetical protein GSI_05016 [Ganoderma sinense ZZ0214-1]
MSALDSRGLDEFVVVSKVPLGSAVEQASSYFEKPSRTPATTLMMAFKDKITDRAPFRAQESIPATPAEISMCHGFNVAFERTMAANVDVHSSR